MSHVNQPDASRANTLAAIEPHVRRCKSILHVGEQMRDGWEFWPDWFAERGVEVFDCLEIYPPNVEALRAMPRWRHVYHADVRKLDLLCDPLPVDIVFWWHGPEHLWKKEIPCAIAALEAVFDPALLIIGAPFGTHRNWGHKFKNTASYHRSALYPQDLWDLGFATETDGKADTQRGHISAWKIRGAAE